MRVLQKVLRLLKILDLSYTWHIQMGLPSTEINTEIFSSFSTFIKSGSMLLQQKIFYSGSFFSEANNFIKKLLYIYIYIYIYIYMY